MLALILLAAGIALIIGSKDSKDLAGRLARSVISLALVVTALPFLVQSCRGIELGSSSSSLPTALGRLLAFAGVAALALGGLALWRNRASRARFREVCERRNGSPRARALPGPPARPDEDRSQTDGIL